MKTDSQRLSQNMVCAGFGSTVTLVTSGNGSQVQQTQSSARPTAGSSRLLQPLLLLLQAPKMLGHAQDMTLDCPFQEQLLSEHCCCYIPCSQTCPGEYHTVELFTHLMATGRTCCRTTSTKLQVKPQGRWQDLRKGHLIFYSCLKLKSLPCFSVGMVI